MMSLSYKMIVHHIKHCIIILCKVLIPALVWNIILYSFEALKSKTLIHLRCSQLYGYLVVETIIDTKVRMCQGTIGSVMGHRYLINNPKQQISNVGFANAGYPTSTDQPFQSLSYLEPFQSVSYLED